MSIWRFIAALLCGAIAAGVALAQTQPSQKPPAPGARQADDSRSQALLEEAQAAFQRGDFPAAQAAGLKLLEENVRTFGPDADVPESGEAREDDAAERSRASAAAGCAARAGSQQTGKAHDAHSAHDRFVETVESLRRRALAPRNALESLSIPI